MASKKKAVTQELVDAQTGDDLNAITKDLIEKHHHHLRNATIAFAWAHSWQEDIDGHLTLGQAKKVGELERDATGVDFYILLNSETWPKLSEAQRVALIDHELCHCDVTLDSRSEPQRDVKDRIVYRLRNHDFQEFADIVRRHKGATPGLNSFAKSAQLELFTKGDPS